MLITGDETLVHHHKSESKNQSMEWCHTTSPKLKKFKAQIMAIIFWDTQGVILVDFLPRGKLSTLNHISRPQKNLEQKSNE